MPTTATLVTEYQGVLQITKRMLLLASSDDWESLIELQTQYITAVNHINEQTECNINLQVSKKEIEPLLKDILINEKKLRDLLQIRLDRLSEVIHHSVKHKTVNDNYNSNYLL